MFALAASSQGVAQIAVLGINRLAQRGESDALVGLRGLDPVQSCAGHGQALGQGSCGHVQGFADVLSQPTEGEEGSAARRHFAGSPSTWRRLSSRSADIFSVLIGFILSAQIETREFESAIFKHAYR
ncbi:MAG: hypothetical protein EON54_21305 [Alcaligenaceae bacterium]|nr:MAG: hypothetical protein EON54_21305 [Alcaligenaceae bacterium]